MKKYLKLPLIILGIITAEQITTSCAKDDELSITEPQRYTNEDIKSYGDMFKVFWTVMDERYNYFYEQKRRDNKDWKAIYNEYYPKFAALKTYNRPHESDEEITADFVKAKKYFEEIIDPIIDRHFKVNILFYVTKNYDLSYNFRGKYERPEGKYFGFDTKFGYMKDKLEDNSIIYDNLKSGNKMLAGPLKSNPDIYYLSFESFEMRNYLPINIPASNFFTPLNPQNALNQSIVDESVEIKAIRDANERKKARDFTLDILNQWNAFFSSGEVKELNNKAEVFKTNEVMSDDFLNAATKVQDKFNNLVKYDDPKIYSTIQNDKTSAYIQWFIKKMKEHANIGYFANNSIENIKSIISRSPFYKKFLNPLHQGTIKKIIIDLRDNGGGYVVDGRIMDRFNTKNAVMGYQRTKISSGRYSYTPWVPIEVKPAKFGMPRDIPIVVLINRNSVSMSEITTLALKSQGSQVVTMGEYSRGGTAGLGDEEKYNGGVRNASIFDFRIGVFKFYMPLMALKNPNGEVIEGIGIKPDIAVAPPTEEEVSAMKSSPKTFVDRNLKEAIKYLSSK